MKHFLLGLAAMAAVSAALWLTWGRAAVRLAANEPDPALAAERCVAFWFGAATPGEAPALRRLCDGAPHGARRHASPTEGIRNR